MLALIQRVNFAKVVVEGTVTGEIQKGILAFIGFEKGDDEAKAKKMFEDGLIDEEEYEALKKKILKL